MNEHKPVLLAEVLEGLNIQASGKYVDATFGRGGHSQAILGCLGSEGKLMALDQDPAAVRVAREAGPFQDPRFCIEHANFSQLKALLQDRGWNGKVDGILLDLGVSSPQLDDPDRGFSFLKDGPLDMRMNTEQKMDAATWLNTAKEKEIADVIYEYGEERQSRRIARAIVFDREKTPFTRTLQLSQMIARILPNKEKNKHPATRTFQAIRIFINRELDVLSTVLNDCVDILAPNGRLCVISFHSLEDRIVKQFMDKQSKGDELPANLPIKNDEINVRMRKIGKSIKPNDSEINDNPRARSARLRIAEKIR